MPEIRKYTVSRTQEVDISAESPAHAIAISETVWDAEVVASTLPVGYVRTVDTSAREKY